jgi:hypothetical protein
MPVILQKAYAQVIVRRQAGRMDLQALAWKSPACTDEYEEMSIYSTPMAPNCLNGAGTSWTI